MYIALSYPEFIPNRAPSEILVESSKEWWRRMLGIPPIPWVNLVWGIYPLKALSRFSNLTYHEDSYVNVSLNIICPWELLVFRANLQKNWASIFWYLEGNRFCRTAPVVSFCCQKEAVIDMSHGQYEVITGYYQGKSKLLPSEGISGNLVFISFMIRFTVKISNIWSVSFLPFEGSYPQNINLLACSNWK